MQKSRLSLALAVLWTVAACGSDSAPPADTPDAAVQPPPGAYVTLIKADWSLAAGQEGYICATHTLTEDMYVGAIRPVAPTGTHHTVVNLGAPQGADSPGVPCGPEFGRFYASGVGTQELLMPEGVGLIAHKGQQVRINLHLFNASDQTLSGTSGIEVKLLDPAKVQHEASINFYGPLSFTVPASGQPYTEHQIEPISAGTTVFAIFPHMHQTGSHFKAEIVHADSTRTMLWDDAYQFESQEFSAIPHVEVKAGDTIDTTCTWVNDTGQVIRWGDSSKAEMCFTILMAY